MDLERQAARPEGPRLEARRAERLERVWGSWEGAASPLPTS